MQPSPAAATVVTTGPRGVQDHFDRPLITSVLWTSGHPYRGVSVSVRSWTTVKVRQCLVSSLSVRHS
jgi:hypothetical protein